MLQVGSAIYTDWSSDNTYASLFGAQWMKGDNHSVVTVTDSKLASGITNPILLQNVGWGIYSMDATGVAIAATFENGNGAIVKSGKSIVNGFLSDTFADGAQGKQLYINETGVSTSLAFTPQLVIDGFC